ncbi:MAG TPA: type II secretion system minor pseudopilin GspI [Gammaproteobacteria bacterium]
MASTRLERASSAGFTLLEVMVALVIVALGMMAVNTQLGRYAVGAARIEEKTLASWIATNKITELSVQNGWPEIGEQEEELEFAGRMWHLRTEIFETQVPNLRRVEVAVSFSESPDDVVHEVMGLVEPPPPRGFVPASWLPPAVEAGG